MGRACEICGKTLSTGNRIVRHGLAKAKGGIGLHTTGITRRKFLPNLQRIRVKGPQGGVSRKTVCTSCIRSDRVVKG
jgi:large subunit ribosomal protein L28